SAREAEIENAATSRRAREVLMSPRYALRRLRLRKKVILSAIWGCRRVRILFPDEALDVVTGDGEDVHVFRDCAETDEAFGEEFAGPEFESLGFEVGHHADDAAALADVGAFVGADIVSNMAQHLVIAISGGVDELVDGLEHADFAEEVDLGH